jgi:hypothetical protein
MKNFRQFISELKTISFKMAKPHKIYDKNRVTNIGAGRAVPKRSSSSAGGNGDGDGGNGGGGNGGE